MRQSAEYAYMPERVSNSRSALAIPAISGATYEARSHTHAFSAKYVHALAISANCLHTGSSLGNPAYIGKSGL